MPSESTAIAAVPAPVTGAGLVADLRALGVVAGDIVLVHTLLSALGWVAGGAQTVVAALLEAVAADGTVVMPTQSGQLSDPLHWHDPPVPADWVPVLRSQLPAYDPYLTPTRAMGQVVECFRQHRGTIRSAHPTVSFAANGKHAEHIVGGHPLAPGLGDSSPLGRLYDLDAKVVLLGVGHDRSTTLHLAEHWATWPGKKLYIEGVPVLLDGERRWAQYQDLVPDNSDFAAIGQSLADAGGVLEGPVGAGVGRVCRARLLVDFGAEWMSRHRT